jgi:PIN domain nuclease of toxin-antitoxin system
VRLLLDTHAFLWFITDDPQLSPNAKALIADPANEIFVSPATLWEVAIRRCRSITVILSTAC